MVETTVDAHDRAALDVEAELSGDHDLLAAPLQRLAEQFLVDEGAVDFCRVEEGHAKVDGAVDRGNRLGIIGRAVGLAHPHAP